MRYLPFLPDEIFKEAWFEEWRTTSESKTADLCAWYEANANGSGTVDRKHYGKLKDSLVKYFNGKCAYCEADFDAVAFGDVEHFRPKLAVTDVPSHRGYYWLAYQPSNLLPSCERCNRQKKGNYFPVVGARALTPKDDLSVELPVLLCPWTDEDCGSRSGHLDFEYELVPMAGTKSPELVFNGNVVGLTERGRESIRIYGLDRPALNRRRAQMQKNGVNAFKLCMGSTAARADWAKEWLSGEKEHSEAVRSAVTSWWNFSKTDADRLLHR